MKNPSISLIRVVIILTGVFGSAALAQPPKNSNQLSHEEQEVLKARKANEEAQAEYYREQTKNLRQPSPSVAPAAGKSFIQSMAENPAGVIGVVGTIAGALIVAFVGLTTLYVNNRNALRGQMDMHFYEALRRLGDRDSPTIRAGASILLARAARIEWRERLVRSKPYFDTALDQLLRAFEVEEHPVAIDSTRDSLEQLIPLAPRSTAHWLHEANLRLQEGFSLALVEFIMLLEPNRKEEDWGAQLKQLTGYNQHELLGFIQKLGSSKETIDTCRRKLQTANQGRGASMSANEQALRITSSRLRANVTLFCMALERFRPQDYADAAFEGSFLVGGAIAQDSDLSGLNFNNSFLPSLSGVNLSKTNFMGAFLNSLSGCDLKESFLMGATICGFWSGVDLSGARLANVNATFTNTLFLAGNWWKADFYNTNPFKREVDDTFLKDLLEHHQKEMPSDPEELHPSVRMYLESRKAGDSTTNSATAE